MKYTAVMGLEIHAELLTKTKIFCNCENSFGESANSRICPICSGFPSTLPRLNKEAVRLSVTSGLILDCKINNYSAFDRKNYFYPDLPKAYQITQFYHPLCADGFVNLKNKTIRIKEIHIEEDAGKLTHNSVNKVSYIDYNRCGVPLIEIVTNPDFRSADEITEFVSTIALRLKYANVCDARLEQGSLRVDVNISIMPENSNIFGTRAEIKNLNSLKSIKKAVEYEISRQTEILESGNKVIQETRRFDENTGKTYAMRSKEDAKDYRYFPEPDIPPLFISDEEITNIKSQIPIMPEELINIYINTYSIAEDDAKLIASDKDFSNFYNETVKLYPSYKTVSTLMLGELNRRLNLSSQTINDTLITPSSLAMLAKMYDEETISKNASKDILRIMFETGKSPKTVAKENDLFLLDDTDTLITVCDKIILQNQTLAEEYKNGNKKIFGYLMGEAIRLAGKNANPQKCKKILEEKLKNQD